MTRVAAEAPRHGGASFRAHLSRAHLSRLRMSADRWRTDAAAISRDLWSRGVSDPQVELFQKATGVDDGPQRVTS
jgi:hypothetical protein